MEENQTINLGNVVNNNIATTSNIISVNTNSEQQTIQTQMEQPTSDILTTQPVVDNNTIIQGDIQQNDVTEEDSSIITSFKLKADIFKTMISNARKAAVCEPRLPITTAIQLNFKTEGLEVISTDGANNLIQKNNTVKFNNNLTIGIAADLLDKLVSKIDTDDIEIRFNEKERQITIVGGGEFVFPEIYEQGSFEPIHIDDKYIDKVNTDYKKIDINGFKDLVSQANIFTGNYNIFRQLSGIYCSDKVYSTDKNNMYGRTNINDLVNDTFCLSKEFVTLLLSLNFDPNNTMIGYVKDDTNIIKAIVIKDDNMILSGPVDEYQSEYPIEVVKGILSKSFNSSFTFDKNKLVSILDKASLFLIPGTDRDSAKFTISNNTLRVDTFNNNASQSLAISNSTVQQEISFNLQIINTKNALDNLNSDEITMTIDVEGKTMVILRDKDTIEILSIMNEI